MLEKVYRFLQRSTSLNTIIFVIFRLSFKSQLAKAQQQQPRRLQIIYNDCAASLSFFFLYSRIIVGAVVTCSQ